MDFPGDDDGAGAMNRFQKSRAYLRRANEHGVALIITLWIFIFLFVVAFNFSAVVRDEADAAHRFDQDTQGYYLAVAGFQRGIYEFLMQSQGAVVQPQEPQQRKDNPAGFFDGTWRDEEIGNGISRFRLLDESGKVNLNRSDEAMLRRIFTNIGIEEPVMSTIVDSILDWIDPDDLHRANGAENDYYQSLSPSYSAKNGPFDSVEDLLWVRGVTPEIFFGSDGEAGSGRGRHVGLKQIFTIDSPIDRVNLRTAPAEVIHAVLGLTLEKSRAFIEERKKLSEKTINDLLPLLGLTTTDAALQMFIFTNPSVISVEAEGQLKGSELARRVKGVVRLAAGAGVPVGGAQAQTVPGRGGVQLVRWIDREPVTPEE
jgi:general secretion pathway protein K